MLARPQLNRRNYCETLKNSEEIILNEKYLKSVTLEEKNCGSAWKNRLKWQFSSNAWRLWQRGREWYALINAGTVWPDSVARKFQTPLQTVEPVYGLWLTWSPSSEVLKTDWDKIFINLIPCQDKGWTFTPWVFKRLGWVLTAFVDSSMLTII